MNINEANLIIQEDDNDGNYKELLRKAYDKPFTQIFVIPTTIATGEIKLKFYIFFNDNLASSDDLIDEEDYEDAEV